MSMFALIAATNSHADDAVPTRPNFSRYETMLQHSPFAVASAVAPPAATPNFAKDLYVANAGHSPDGDMVTIASTSDKNFKEYLTTKGSVDGYSIANIEWSPASLCPHPLCPRPRAPRASAERFRVIQARAPAVRD